MRSITLRATPIVATLMVLALVSAQSANAATTNEFMVKTTASTGSIVTQAAVATTKPGPGNTGVPAGTALTVYNGDLVITKPGTVITALDIRGYVSVQADNVTIRKSIIRGGAAATTNRALVAAWWQHKNFVIEDSTLVAANRSLRIDGLSGSGITAQRLNIYGVVDGVKVIGNNVSVSGSWIHDTIYSTSDPNQSDGKTHDDSFQVEGGSNITISGNSAEDAHNSAVMVTQNRSATSNLHISGNWFKDGACTVNVTQTNRGPITGSSITSNRFGAGHYGYTCAVRVPKTSPFTISGNLWDATSKGIVPQVF